GIVKSEKMINPITLALLYAISKVCEGVSLNVISSTVFESFKDKIYKQGGKSEKELLKDVIQELKKSDNGDDSLKEIIENINCCIHLSSGQKRFPLFPANPKLQILNHKQYRIPKSQSPNPALKYIAGIQRFHPVHLTICFDRFTVVC
ncbi:hypothetical protein C5S35_11025, partial [Candidatus Methanophagaceae archaeon]